MTQIDHCYDTGMTSLRGGAVSEIAVWVIRKPGKTNFYLRYKCPITGQIFSKSSGTKSENDARKKAGEWQAQLKAGIAARTSTRWEAFRDAYESHKVSGLRPRTQDKALGALNVVQQLMNPDDLRRITPQWMQLLVERLRKSDRAPATVESILRHFKAALNWAHEQSLMLTVPKIPRQNKVRMAKLMKGRPITTEEFERMLAAVETVWPDFKHDRNDANLRRKEQRSSIKFLLHGLWLSGLRLGEALNLTWDQWDDGIWVDMTGEFVKLRIPAEAEKGGQDRLYPVTPDFAELLRLIPATSRTGFVFNPILSRGVCRRTDTVSKAISLIGESAGVKVDAKPSKESGGKPKPVWASAHDLRRAFGYRWSRCVNSMVLRDLMRHASVTTTEKYYVGISADDTSRMLQGLLQQSSLRLAGATNENLPSGPSSGPLADSSTSGNKNL